MEQRPDAARAGERVDAGRGARARAAPRAGPREAHAVARERAGRHRHVVREHQVEQLEDEEHDAEHRREAEKIEKEWIELLEAGRQAMAVEADRVQKLESTEKLQLKDGGEEAHVRKKRQRASAAFLQQMKEADGEGIAWGDASSNAHPGVLPELELES